MQFLESINVIKEDELDVSDVESILEQLVQDDVLVVVDAENRKYKLLQ